jgi:hypothetical protein
MSLRVLLFFLLVVMRRSGHETTDYHKYSTPNLSYLFIVFDMGSCTICKKESISRCPICKTSYCSANCQKEDYSHHKASCYSGKVLCISGIHDYFGLKALKNALQKLHYTTYRRYIGIFVIYKNGPRD